MNSKGITIGLVVLVGLIGATAYVYRPAPAETNTTATATPWTTFEASRVDRVILTRPTGPEDQRTMEFEKQNGAWRMVRPGQGPTEARSVEDLVERFAEMRVNRVAGRQASSYEAFGVDDGHGTRVTLKAGGGELLNVVVGNGLGGGTAIRVANRPEVYEVNASVSSMVTREARDWRNREVVHAARDAVRGVSWTSGGVTRAFERNGDAWAAAAGTTVERLDPARVGSLVDTLSNLRATDFAAADAETGLSEESPRAVLTLGGDAGASTIALRLGANHGEGEFFVMKEGDPVVYIISRSQAEAVNPPLTALQTPADGGAPADASTPAPAAAPPTPPSPGGPTPQIPPELLEQIRRQMQQQGGAH